MTETAGRFGNTRPELHGLSRGAAFVEVQQSTIADDEVDEQSDDSETTPTNTWVALCAVPDEGWDVGELIRG